MTPPRLIDTRLGRAHAYAGAGAALAAAELILVVGSCWHLFLSWVEVMRFALMSLWAPLGLCLVVGMGGDLVVSALAAPRRAVWLRSLLLLVTAPLLAWAFWSLTDGRRLQGLPFRAWAAAGFGLAVGILLAYLVGPWQRALTDKGDGARRWGLALCALSAAALVCDGLVLRRLYPALHGLLAATAVCAAVLAGAMFATRSSLSNNRPRLRRGLLVAAVIAAPLGVLSLRAAPNLRFVVEQAAPINGKLLSAVPAPSLHDEALIDEATVGAGRVDGTAAGLDLRGRDVLLISVDALRADRLRAHGGDGLTPAMDALAESGVVFERAYTTTPHTSYAVTSLLTGKYMRAVMALAATGGDVEGPGGANTAAAPPAEHVTLPDILRRYGYRTAAFYPPAIFFVDQHRFARLSERQLGFEYEKRMFADGEARVAQLVDYLEGPGAGHPVFAWVHLFEPHEPYDPAPEFVRGDSPEARYDGEVAQADAAVGQLVEAFRRRRPDGLVVVTADHGEEFGDHGGYHHGTTLFDEQVRVPLIWSAPGVLASRRVRQAVDLVDVPTTVVSLLGMPRDVRMRGDDLAPLLAGADAGEALLAFSATADAQMATDGRFKLICKRSGGCRLFNLHTDPKELRDLADVDPGTVSRLRAQLGQLSASIPQVEALAMAGGGGVPEALARARLGDRQAAGDLVPLLGARRASVRAGAAQALGRFEQRVALPVLTRLSEYDPDDDVRAEALVARVRLGDRDAHGLARDLLSIAPLATMRRAALALAQHGDGAGLDTLTDWMLDDEADEEERRQAVAGLAALRDPRAVPDLTLALQRDVRLRPDVATALGRIGGQAVADALAHALAVERYPESRLAEGWALTSLGDRRLTRLVCKHLGRQSGMPEGLAMLAEVGALDGPARKGYRLAETPAVREGHFLCEPGGCWPSVSAALSLPRLSRIAPARVIARVHAELNEARLSFAGQRFSLKRGSQQVAVTLQRPTGAVPLSADPGVLVEAVAVVPAVAEIPPPPPEPWQEGDGQAQGPATNPGP